MKGIILFSVVSLQFCWTYGAGLGHFDFQDAAGGRYGGQYNFNDGQAYNFAGPNDIPFGNFPAPFADFQDQNNFFPEYFRNFQNLIQQHIGTVHTVEHPGGISHQMTATHHGPGPYAMHQQTSSSSSTSSSEGLGMGMPIFPMGQQQHQAQSQIQAGPMGSPYQSQSQSQNQANVVPVVTMPVVHHQVVPSYNPVVYYNTPQAFAKSSQDQKKALDAARKAFDLTSNQAGFTPDFGFDRFPQYPLYSPQFPMAQYPLRTGLSMNPFSNAAFAGAAAGPGFQRQMINLYPPNAQKPNIQVSQFSDPSKPTARQGGFYSVQSSSFASSSNVNGEEVNHKGGETIVNDNGKVTQYSLGD